jgi:hypothetical protein
MNPADTSSEVQVALQAVQVLNDGGMRQGYLVLCGGSLAAVLIAVTEEDTGTDPGWYVEAGFGPCSALRVVNPPVFAQLEEVAPWVLQQMVQSSN